MTRDIPVLDGYDVLQAAVLLVGGGNLQRGLAHGYRWPKRPAVWAAWARQALSQILDL
jgi:hypothetical protein